MITPQPADPGAPLTPGEIASVAAKPIKHPEFKGISPEFALPAKIAARLGSPDMISEYRYADGGLAFVVCRWNTEPRKTIRPFTWDGAEWQMQQLRPTPRPLLNAPQFFGNGAPVLVVEGEKACDGARPYLPPGWVVTTWAGGAENWPQHDWTALSGHSVVIWPDNDAPGRAAALAIEAHLHGLGIAACVAQLPDFLPPGWDLGDDLIGGWKPTTVTKALMRFLSRADVPAPMVDGRTADDLLPPVANENNLGDPDIQWQALGAKDGEFFFLSKRSQRIEVLRTGALLTKVGALQLVPDMEYWAAHAHTHKRKVDFSEVGATLMSACYARGVYTPRRVRGRGGWMDEGRVVFHNGDSLWVDGATMRPGDARSHYIYPQEDRFGDMDLSDVEPLSDADGRLILDICRHLRWEDSTAALYVAGWMATAPVCGLLPWRPHIWVTGTRGSGKSWLLNSVVGRILSPFSLNVKGATTEAGIRSTLGRDARPVIFDEAEPGDNPATRQRMEALLELIRQASAETDAEQLKGSSTHVAYGFNVRSQFLCGSIAVPLARDADESRFMVCTLRQPLPGPKGEVHFADLRKMVARLPPDCAARLLKRQLANAGVLRQSAETLAAAIAGRSGTRRQGDQVGTLLAGVWTLLHRKPIRPAQAEEWAARVLPDPEGEEAEAATENEAHGLLRAALSSLVRVTTEHRTVERSLGELLLAGLAETRDDAIPTGEAKRALERYGVKILDSSSGEPGVAFATGHEHSSKLFEASPYGVAWSRILAGLPGAGRTPALRFAGSSHRTIWVPRGQLFPPAPGSEPPPSSLDEDLRAAGFRDDDLPF